MYYYLVLKAGKKLRRAGELHERRAVLALCFLTDALLLWCAMNIATLTRLHTLMYLDNMWLLHRDQLVCVLVYLAAIALARAYNPLRITDRFDSVYYSCIGVTVSAVLVLGLSRLLPRELLSISGRELLLGPFLGAMALILWRYYLGGLASRFASLHRYFCVLGTEKGGRRIAAAIAAKPNARADARYVTLDELQEAVETVETEQSAAGGPPFFTKSAIIVATELKRGEAVRLVEFCDQHFGRTFLYPSAEDILLFGQSRLLAIAGIPLIEVWNRQLSSPYIYLKRLFDLGCAAAGLILALPICVITALAIKITSPGPVFYSQERMGLHGRRFRLHKFRSMIPEAEAHTGPMWARADDDRVTPVGRFIRKHRIDEIPQLFNVLKGDMSLIGPRPERPHFHEEFCGKWPLFERRLAVRPGVTSLSHVLGSYDSEPSDRLRYDLMYISSLSPITDLKILAATVRVVLGAKGAQ